MAGQVTTNLKATLRREILAARDALPAALRTALNSRTTHQLLTLDTYRSASCVLAYMSFGSEFDTSELVLDVLSSGKQLCLPRINPASRKLEIRLANSLEHDLEVGVWGIREPRADQPRADLDRIDFMLLPGVAFTPRCDRLGYGRGFYDRLITEFAARPPLIAAAFDLQIRDEIPLSANDQRVDCVITESSIYGGESRVIK